MRLQDLATALGASVDELAQWGADFPAEPWAAVDSEQLEHWLELGAERVGVDPDAPVFMQRLSSEFKLPVPAIERVVRRHAEDPDAQPDEQQQARIRRGLVEREYLYLTLAERRGLPYLAALQVEPELLPEIREIGFQGLRDAGILPLRRSEEGLEAAVADPEATASVELIEGVMGGPVLLSVASPGSIQQALTRIFEEAGDSAEAMIDDLGEEFGGGGDAGDVPIDLLESGEDDAPIIRLVNRILRMAVRDRASDIHIEPFEGELVVRLRIDGILYPVLRPPKQAQASIVSRVKIMAGMNIAEKRLPQDGRIRIRIAGRDVDIRVSSLPTSHGERLVLRILDRSQVILDLDDLGFEKDQRARWDRLIERPYGILLVTGPTGSGKTTTLYASLSQINSPDKNILTIEDPVEYQLRGVGQMNVSTKIGLTFAAGLRTSLRQDPDVILVGEIRDLETAEIAIQASLTGHLVFSTLHTNDAPGAITRLADMGVEPFLVSSSLLGVLAQRLVRRICPACRAPVEVEPAVLSEIGLSRESLETHGDGHVYEGRGCDACMGTGYRGRQAISELMLITERLHPLIVQNKDAAAIRRAAVKDGMRTLREDGALKVAKGLTTIAEVLRVTQEELAAE